jgi:hypothetical protein
MAPPDLDHVLSRAFHGLLDSDRDLAGLAGSESDTPLAVSDDGQGGEAELAATLHNFGDPVYRHQLF